MTDDVSKTGRPRRTPLLLLTVLTLLGCGISVFTTLRDIDEIEARHRALLEDEVRRTARDIAGHLAERQRLIGTFVAEHIDLVNRFAADPGNESLRQQIGGLLRERFPLYFTFTIADPAGRDLVNDIEGLVGQACQSDIQEYVEHLSGAEEGEAHYRTVIHPQAGHYHYDVMAPWSAAGTLKGVFFVSFFPGKLAAVIRANQSTGHLLAVVNTDQPQLLEFSAEGARDKIALRRDIRLSDAEIQSIMARENVPNSRWRVIGSVRTDILAKERADQWVVPVLIVIGLVIGWMAGAFWLTRK